jgi:hypothetical protein
MPEFAPALPPPETRPSILAALVAALFAAFIGRVRAEHLMWREVACMLLRRPRPSERVAQALGEGRRFPLHRGSFASVLMPMIVLTLIVDESLAHGLIHVLIPPTDRLVLHLLMIASSLWLLAWGLALRSATRRVDHVLHAEALTLAVGLRDVCRIPLAAIKDVHVIKAGQKVDWRDERRLKRREFAILSPIDPATVLIELHADRTGCIHTRFGIERDVPAWVAVYVDKATELRAALLEVRHMG